MTPRHRPHLSYRNAPHATALAAVGVGLLCAGLISACSDADRSCDGPEATTPAAAHPGQTIRVPVANLSLGCLDEDARAAASPDTVTLQLVDGDTREAVATSTADVGTDAAVVVKITVPKDASGTLAFVLDGDELASLEVVPRP